MRWIIRSVVGVVAVLAAILAMAAPASAHDRLLDSSPSSGERLEEAPDEITLIYSGELLTLGDGQNAAVVLVVDDDGHDWATGEVRIDGGTLTAPLAGDMPEAGYQVRWQVVSEDGHPITGTVPFTIGDEDPYVGPADETAAPAGGEQSADTGDGRIVLVALGGAVAAGGLFVTIQLLRRRSASRGASDAPQDS
ncbi:copper resistance CopC family protein [Microbacterium karelineae]|uniref:copper resistance CopC family protein n=1 Tax=Microbacterium karelineae TaxID=2654283 RepID=UPI0012EA7312|nr:copper resistance CopC family protein [Microbacterium karelineae]